MPSNDENRIEALFIEIDADSKDAASGLQKLTAAVERLDKAVHKGGLDQLYEKLHKIAGVNIGKFPDLGKTVKSAGTESETFSNSIAKIENKMTSIGKKIDEVTAKIQKATKSADELSERLTPGDVPFSPDYMPQDKIIQTEDAIKRTWTFSERIKSLWEYTKNHFSSAAKAADEIAKKTEKAEKATKKLENAARKSHTAFDSIKTILLYSGLFSLVSNVTKGITTGLQNLASASDKANAVLSQYTSINDHLSNSIAAALIPMLERVYPLYNALANVVIDVADSLNILFSALNGETVYYKANLQAKDYLETVNKVKNAFAGMDEINVLQFSAQSTSSTGAFGETVTFEKFDVTEIVGNIALVTGALTGLKLVMEGIDFAGWFKGLEDAFGGVNKLKLGLSIGAIAVGIKFISSGLADFQKYGPTLKNTLEIVGGIVGAFGALALIIGNPWLVLVGGIAGAVAAIGIWGDEITSWLTEARANVDSFFKNAKEKVASFFDYWIAKCDGFCAPFSFALEIAKNLVTGFLDFVGKSVDLCISTVQLVASTLRSVFEGDFKGAFDNLKVYGANWGVDFVNFLVTPFNWLLGVLETVGNAIVDVVNWTGGLFGSGDLLSEVTIKKISVSKASTDAASVGAAGAVSGAVIPAASGAISGAIKLPAYATGGFPEDGLFMANHNEIIGTFAGRAAVANNFMIVEGIADGVKEAQSDQNELIREQNELLRQLLKKSGGSVSVSAITKALDRQNRRAGRVVVPIGT